MDIKARIEQLQEQHGGVRAAARAIRISPSYMIRLRDGEKFEPGNKILRKLGLQKEVRYTLVRAK